MPINTTFTEMQNLPALPGLIHVPGRWYTNTIANANTVATMTANVLFATPILVPVTRVYSLIGINVTTASATRNIRLGLYADKSVSTGSTDGGYPDALVLDAGVVSAATILARWLPLNKLLKSGWYWMAAVLDGGTPAVNHMTAAGCLPFMGFSSLTDVTFHVGWSKSFTYAALPDPFGGGAVTTVNVPAVRLYI